MVVVSPKLDCILENHIPLKVEEINGYLQHLSQKGETHSSKRKKTDKRTAKTYPSVNNYYKLAFCLQRGFVINSTHYLVQHRLQSGSQ